MKKLLKSLKVRILMLILLLPLVSLLYAFIPNSKNPVMTEISLDEGKAWWFTYHSNDFSKKAYVSRVYNNDCNHCRNEINAAFRKWLVMHDYLTQVSGDLYSQHDASESSLQKRRDEYIYKYKQMGYSVINVSFTYTED
ncbi:MAG: hypothetical protein C0433_12385 [Cyclobacterium sp.]|nr:hypothetical protein [Cyclobacterium sp.]